MPYPQPEQGADPDVANRLVLAVFGDLDYVDRLETMLKTRPALTDADVDAVVEQAVVEAVRQARAGVAIDDPQALVWWLAQRKAGRLLSDRGGETLPLDEVGGREAPATVAPGELVRWRGLVARIDQERPRQVWTLILGAVEAGEDLLHAWEIARHLGIPEPAVEKAISRGRLQLRRLVEADGLVRILEDGTLIVDFDQHD